MIPDHDCVPGLERAVTLSEYATLENLREADVLAVIGQQKIPSAYFRGQWFLEAPRNCEARLAQLRGEQPTPRNDKANIPHNDKGNIPALEDKEFWGRIEREGSSYEPQPEPQRAHQERQPVSETRGYRLSELPRKDRIEHYVHLDLESQKPPPSAALAKPSTTPDRLQPVNCGLKMTPETYIAAVKACPRVAWVHHGHGKWIWRGYATRLDGDKVEVVPDFFLKSKDTVRRYAEASTPNKLWAMGSNGIHALFVKDMFFGEIPSEGQLRTYYVSKHGKLRGLNWLFPRRIEDAATMEWLEDQLERQRTNSDLHRESELNRLQNNLRRTEERMAAEKGAVLKKREYAVRPEPVDYGLTYDDVNPGLAKIYGTNDGLNYKKGRRWFGILGSWKFFLAIWPVIYAVSLVVVSSNTSRELSLGGAILVGFLVTLFTFGILNIWFLEAVHSYKRKHPSPNLAAYQRALELHESYKAAEQEAEQALQRRKRSYWESLNGYQFERETAEILKRYQFSPRLTPGSADGGVDIEVTRNGLRGVVQCKAHVNCVGPSVVRDLYGVIHHSGVDFGIVVSRGGFTRGAFDFARGKPIYFLDTDGLIAMQEGRDVLAKAFTHTDT